MRIARARPFQITRYRRFNASLTAASLVGCNADGVVLEPLRMWSRGDAAKSGTGAGRSPSRWAPGKVTSAGTSPTWRSPRGCGAWRHGVGTDLIAVCGSPAHRCGPARRGPARSCAGPMCRRLERRPWPHGFLRRRCPDVRFLYFRLVRRLVCGLVFHDVPFVRASSWMRYTARVDVSEAATPPEA
jgi:hypothetical protein